MSDLPDLPDLPDLADLAVAALTHAVADLDGRLRVMMDEAASHLDRLLRSGPPEAVGAVAVAGAVFRALSDAAVPHGLLASSAATYLAFGALDDQMDGDPPAFWAGLRAGEIGLGAQVLLQTANHTVADGAPPDAAHRLRGLYRAMLTESTEGQLLSEVPLSEVTTPAAVEAVVAARSGAMLARFAQMAAVAAGAGHADVEAARAFGQALGSARQHVNDLTELTGDRTADLRNRTATVAVAIALQRLPESGRTALLDRLDAAADDPDARRAVVHGELAPSIADACVLVRLHLADAQRHVRFLTRHDRGHDGLDRLIGFTGTVVRSNHVR
jgi:hypothetical protein